MYYLKKVQNHYSVTFIRNKAEETNVINHTQRKMIFKNHHKGDYKSTIM